MQNWYQRCVPLKVLKTNEQLPDYFAKSQFKTYFFNKWIRRYKENATENISLEASMLRCFSNLENMWQCRIAYYFRRWRQSLIRKNDKIKFFRSKMF